jgi:capsular exopolysaccharide synthesis family protein
MEDKRKPSGNILSFYESESPVATEFRRVYSNLRNYLPGQEIKSVLITSPALGEGKSTLASLLSIEIAHRHNKKVILIDCDLRRPNLHRLFALNQERGLSELLQGKLNLQDCLKPTPLENLKVMTSGQETQTPAELIDTPYLQEVIAEAKLYSNLVIADCAPVIPVSDPLIIGPLMDGVILVLKAGSTQVEVAKRAVEILRNAQVKLLGVIMNNMDEVLPYYYSYKYYGYEYGYTKKRK